MKFGYIPIAMLLVSLLVISGAQAQAPTSENQNAVSGAGAAAHGPVVIQAAYQGVSEPEERAAANASTRRHQNYIPFRGRHLLSKALSPETKQPDQVLQQFSGPLVSTIGGLDIAGLGEDFPGFAPSVIPPDTNASVGTTQVVETVNLDYVVFNKNTGAVAPGGGATALTSLFASAGDACGGVPSVAGDSDIQFDPIVKFDQLAQRWVITFAASDVDALSNPAPPFLQCIAVSKTADATGTYNIFVHDVGFLGGAANSPAINDFPKLGVWPDAYYFSWNEFSSSGTEPFLGAAMCAFPRPAPSSAVCFDATTTPLHFSLLPSDLDGATSAPGSTSLPPTGSPNFFIGNLDRVHGFDLWKFHVDFTTTSNSTFTGPTFITVSPYNLPCGGTGATCVPQPGGDGTQLDTLGDDLMFRNAYRNFARPSPAHESIVLSHSIAETTSGSCGVAVRWYEIRSPNGTPTVFQQGTFSPDNSCRWMPSIGADRKGNIAMGYSVSDAVSVHPSIRYTGRTTSDAAGTMETEKTVVVGTGSQEGSGVFPGLTRWGDYSSMAIDPTDDCTFWYAQEYMKISNPSGNPFAAWSTRLASFQFASAATHFLITAPANTTAGSSFSVTVEALDSSNKVVPSYCGTVHFTSSDPMAVLPANSVLSNGVGTFQVTLKTAGTQTITATDKLVSTTTASASIAVTPAAATHYSLSAPSSVMAGVAFSLTVKALDAFGNVATGYAGTAHFASSDPMAVLAANSTLVAGVKTFSVTLKTADIAPMLTSVTATDTVQSTIKGSANIAVIAAAATHFSLSAPSSVTAGVPFSLSVTARDAFGNVATGYTGTVHFTSSDPMAVLPGNSTLSFSFKTFSVTLKTAGTRILTATDTVKTTITGSVSTTVKAGAATHYMLSVPSSVMAGVAFSLTVKALDAFGNVATGYTGTVHFSSADTLGVLPADSTLVAGVKTFSVTLKSGGTQTVTATDPVQTTIKRSVNITVLAATHFSLSAPASVTAGVAFSVTVKALDAFGDVAPGYTGTVHFTSTDPAGVLPADSTLVSGVKTFSVTLKSGGTQTVTATDPVQTTIKGSASITVTVAPATSTSLTASLNPSVFGQGVTFTATVTSLTLGTISGTVTFKDGAAVLSTGTVSSGKATLLTSALSAGTHSITAVFSGSSSFGASTSAPLSHTVNKASTSAAVSSSLNPSAFGQSVTFTATVVAVSPGNGTPTGTATFKNGATVLGSGTLAGGKASFSTSIVAAGADSITAAYNGSSNYNTSTSATLTQTVNKAATSTTLKSSMNPSMAGFPVPFTVTVAAIAPGSGTPTGSVTLKDGTTALQTLSLSGGTALFSISSLAHGSHSITAVYAGSANDLPSTSPVVVQIVN